MCLQGLFIFLIYGVYNTEVGLRRLKAVALNERNDKFLMGSLLNRQAGGVARGMSAYACGGVGRSGGDAASTRASRCPSCLD